MKYMNIMSGVVSMILGLAMVYFLFNGGMDMINYAPSELATYIGALYIVLCVTLTTFVPFIMISSGSDS